MIHDDVIWNPMAFFNFYLIPLFREDFVYWKNYSACEILHTAWHCDSTTSWSLRFDWEISFFTQVLITNTATVFFATVF
jgi:hypothetical protein